MKTTSLPPPENKARSVRQMFGAIAPRYDLLNHLLSLNRDRAWRTHAVNRLLAGSPADGRFLDACAGTLDLAVELASRPSFRGLVLATDFSLPMLRAGLEKRRQLHIQVCCSDALQQPVADASFDGAMVAFGVRNLASLSTGLVELARVLKPGARLVILEFTTPSQQPFRALYLLYFRRILPLVGRFLSGHSSAYSYLPASVLEFPAPHGLAEQLTRAGFRAVHWTTLTLGIVSVHSATRA
jgi:demethylmenaquinone methyltransferase/2-methoxy-6-polyprenyl-1,4-benzoquinol methylase